ncbi:MAG: hypothetical protein L3J65_05870 [Robiginitomaculum sp.]|nr:hypothetical protein [Robiginitomaculum sp.]
MSNAIKNTLEGRKNGGTVQAIFNPRTIILLVVLGVFSFGAFFTLSGFSGDLKSGNNGGTHALSKSAVGYGGLLHLLKQNDNTVNLSRSYVVRDDDRYAVRIVSLTGGWFSNDLDEMALDTPTLIIMPKWRTRNHPKQKGWVQRLNKPNPDMVKTGKLITMLKPVVEDIEFNRSEEDSVKVSIFASVNLGTDEDTSFYNFEHLQTIMGDGVQPVLVSDKGTILAQVPDTEVYILSDPDFMNTLGLSHPDRAEFAYDILQMIEEETGATGYVFDLSLHGFVRSQNLIKLAITPPFLAATLCLLAMGLLIAWQAKSRFGDPAQASGNLAMGKLSLIMNAAGFIKIAGREYKMAADYADLTRKTVLDTLHIPSALPEKDKTKRLDVYSKYAGADSNWTDLEAEKTSSKNANDLMKNARKLYKWRGDITHERN